MPGENGGDRLSSVPSDAEARAGSQPLPRQLPSAVHPEGSAVSLESAIGHIASTGEPRPENTKPETVPIEPASMTERIGLHKGVPPSEDDLARLRERERQVLVGADPESRQPSPQILSPAQMEERRAAFEEARAKGRIGGLEVSAIEGRDDAIKITDPETNSSSILENNTTEQRNAIDPAEYAAWRSGISDDDISFVFGAIEDPAVRAEWERRGLLGAVEMLHLDESIKRLDTDSWSEDQKESLEIVRFLDTSSREGARQAIQCVYSLPVEGWTDPALAKVLTRAIGSYEAHLRGIPELKLSMPDVAEELLATEAKLDELRQKRAKEGSLGDEEEEVFAELQSQFRKLRAQEKEFQRQSSEAGAIRTMLRETLEAREKKEQEEREREDKLERARQEEAVKELFALVRDEKAKNPHDRRTYSKVLSELGEYMDPKSPKHERYLRYQNLMDMQAELESWEGLADEDPSFETTRDEVKKEVEEAFGNPDNIELVSAIKGLLRERDTYRIAAEALGVTADIEGRVKGYYEEHRRELVAGDLKDIGILAQDITVLVDPETHARALSENLDQRRLVRMFGAEARGVPPQVLRQMFDGIAVDYAQEAVIELRAQATRLKQAREEDRPLLTIAASEPEKPGLFSAVKLERSLREELARNVRRRNVEPRTGIRFDEGMKDEDIRLWNRNDYNYIMIHATSKSELVEALHDYVQYRAGGETRWDVQEIFGDIQRIIQLLPTFQNTFGMSNEEIRRLMYETDGTLYALVGDHFDRIGDMDTEVKVGEAFCSTYGAERIEYTYQAGNGIRAWIIDQKQNNPRYCEIFEQLDLLQGEFHNKNHEQRQLYFDLIDALAVESMGVRLKVPSLNQRKLGLDVPRADFRAMYYEDIYSGGHTGKVLAIVAEKKERGITLSSEEIHILNYGKALEAGAVYLGKLERGEVRRDADDQEKLFWLGYIQQKLVKCLPLTEQEKQVRMWFFDPEFAKARADVSLGLAFESFTGEASVRTSAGYMTENGHFVPKKKILAFMHTARAALEDQILKGRKFSTTAEKLKILYERRDDMEVCWDKVLEAVERKGYGATVTIGGEAISLQSAWRDPRSLIIADTYVSTEQITRDVLKGTTASLEALSTSFMYRLDLDPEDREASIVGLSDAVSVSGGSALVRVADVREGAGIFARNRWLLDPQGKILVSGNDRRVDAATIESELMQMGDYSTRKHYFATRRAMRRLGYRPSREARRKASDLGGLDLVGAEDEVVVSANFDPHHRGSGKDDYAIYKIDDRGRYVCLEGYGGHGKIDLKGKIFERQFTGYFVEVSALAIDRSGRFIPGEDGYLKEVPSLVRNADGNLEDKNSQRVVLRPSEASKGPHPENVGLVPRMECRVRMGDENVSAGVARKRLTEMPHYFLMKQNRFARFREIAEVAPGMLMPDSRFHGALDTRGGVSVIKREFDLQKAVENKGEDFLIQEIVSFGMPAVQARIYKRIIGGMLDGKIITPEAAKPTSDGVQFGKGEHGGRNMRDVDMAIQWAGTYRARMERPEQVSDEIYDGYTDKRFGFGSGLARLMQSLWVQDNFDLLTTMGAERDYPDQAEWIRYLHMKYPVPVGNLRDFLMGQMTKGKSNHSTYTIYMPTKFADVPETINETPYTRIDEV